MSDPNNIVATDGQLIKAVGISGVKLPYNAITDASGNVLTPLKEGGSVVVSGTVAVTGAYQATQPVSISGSVPVTGTFYQATQPISGNVGVTGSVAVTGSFYQATQPVSIVGSVPVTGTFFQATQPVSGAFYPLGSANSAASMPVVIASDQVVPISQPLSSASGSITAINGAVALTLNGANALTIQVTGTYTGALSLQGTLDGTNWVTLGANCLLNVATGGYLASITSALTGIFQSDVGGFLQARIVALAAVTGTAVVTLKAAPGAASMLALDAALPPGTNSIGNIGTVSSATLAAGNNAIGAVYQRVSTTSGGASVLKISSAASTNLAVVKASAGNVFQWQVTNSAAYATMVQWFNKATAPVIGTDVPVFQIVIPAGGVLTMPHGVGVYFSLGIGVGITKSDGTTAVAAGDVIGMALYV